MKVKEKPIENINISSNISKNSNQTELKFYISIKNNVIFLNNCTDNYKEKNNLLDKVKIIFKEGTNKNNIIYELNCIKDKWDFKRNVKYIWKRIHFAKFMNRFKINIRNLKYVYLMKYIEKQIQFLRKEATLDIFNKRSFFVKKGNKFIYIIRN